MSFKHADILAQADALEQNSPVTADDAWAVATLSEKVAESFVHPGGLPDVDDLAMLVSLYQSASYLEAKFPGGLPRKGYLKPSEFVRLQLGTAPLSNHPATSALGRLLEAERR